MADWTNEDRAEAAHKAALVFAKECGQQWDRDPQEIIGDLIADLMHLARREGFDPDERVANGVMHFTEEEAEEAKTKCRMCGTTLDANQHDLCSDCQVRNTPRLK